MRYLLTQTVNGISAGSIYALIALGFSMVFGILKLINFAHSEVFTTGVFLSYWVSTWMHSAFPAEPVFVIACSVVLSAVGAGLLAVVIQWVVYEPIRHEPRTRAIISAIATSILLQNVGIQLFGAHTRGFPAVVDASTGRLLTIAGLAVSLAGLLIAVQRTKWGIRARAAAENPAVVELMGISPALVTTVVFFAGGAMAGIAGASWGLVYGTVQPQMGFQPALKSFMIGVLGTPGNLMGAVVVGLALGIVESLAIAYLPSGYSQYRDSLVFALLLACLVLKPSGLFPRAAERA